MNLSPSKVDCYFGCPRLFKYRYIDKLPTKESKYFRIGNVVHAVLEDFHRIAVEMDKDEWKPKFIELFKANMEKYKVKSHEDIDHDDLISIRNMLKGYLKYITENGLPNIVSLEKMFSVGLDDKITIRGKADRVDKLEDKIFKIVDYKTSYRPMTKKEARESVQLPTYKMWLSELKGKDIKAYGEYIYVKHMGTKKAFRTYEIDDDWVEEAKEKYLLLDSELKKDNPKFNKNTAYKYCRLCEYRNLCFKQFIL